MKHLALFGAIFVAMGVQAHGFIDEPTCYSWSGGHKSSGSFSKCTPNMQADHPKPAAKPEPPPVAVPAAVAPTPLMMPVCENPPPPPKHHKPKPKKHIYAKPKPKC